MIQKIFALLLAGLLLVSSASALELTEEELDAWYEDMTYFVDEIGIRKVGRPGEKMAYEYLRNTFLDLGFSYEDGTLYETYCHPSEKWPDDSITLVAIKRAKSENPKIVTVCAHYDSIYQGARDNASGVAALLFLIRTYAQQEAFDDTEIRFIAFAAEEYGMHGSRGYCAQLSEDEIARSLATFNIDIITVDVWEPLAFSIDTMGMRTQDGYVNGSEDQPAYNRTALAMLQAMEELGTYAADDIEYSWCLPRHLGMSDHQAFHESGIDAANICFRGTTEDGGKWPEFMHTLTDVMGDFDMDATWNALNALYTAVDGLVNDHTYGDYITEYPVP